MQINIAILSALVALSSGLTSQPGAAEPPRATDAKPVAESKPAVSPILKALFRIDNDAFVDPTRNEELKALLARKPVLTFFEACGVGDVEAVKRFLVKEPKLAASWIDVGWSALHLAAFSGNAETVRLLLD